MAKVQITETAFRDAHQSLIATRMTTDEILPIAELMDQVGYFSLEMWGGATFDACLRFLNEDPWERLRKIRKAVKNTKLQMLLRGQNILGYKHYPDDVLIEFIKRVVGNGIDIIRIFDALNDVRNLETAMSAAVKEGAHAQAAMSYTISPIHNTQHYIDTAKMLESMGASSICIKDMAGLLKPYTAYELVSELKKEVRVPIDVHSHYTSGLASMTYIKAIEAGADIVDCAISPVAMGSSQPPTEPLAATLQGTPYDTGLDLDILNQIADYFKSLRERYVSSGLLDPKVLAVDVNALVYQVPGGMLSNLVSQLKQQGKEDKLNEVLQEIPRVREDLGYPPLVTPTSQIVGTQAVLNVITGERYKMITKETKAYVRGEYGKPPAEISNEIRQLIIGDEEPITCRPADLIKPALEEYRKAIRGYMQQEEDVLSYALFPQVAENYFKLREAQKYKIDSTQVSYEYQIHPV
ncbi:MAG TPA: oxaloacetate decarboxylase subunit alpha [Clostridiales bacterium]|jgi:oxaloacetate decarboxylase alpha subunit|nr:oxaloacetate decarboxylase subunit alpha [Clostridiales bacterium]